MLFRPLRACTMLVALFLPAIAKSAETIIPDHTMIAAVERFASTPHLEPASAGRILLTELNCVSCHQLTGAAANQLKAKPAPILDQVGARVQLEWLETFLSAPHGKKPGTTMPDVFAGLSDTDRKSNVESLLHFLAKTGAVAEASGDTASVKRGDELFHRIGCVACHGSLRENVPSLPTSVPLGSVHQKYTLPSLIAFLRDPLAVRPGGRMPSLSLDDKQARDIACYFFKDVKIAANVNFAYYEGSWDKLPDFASLSPKTTGQSSGFDLEAAPRKNDFGMRFTGFLHIAKDADYQFHLGSDDGSRLLIDGQIVVDNNGIHAYEEKNARRKLQKGVHPITVDYIQGGGEWTLKVEIESKGLSRQPVSGLVTPTSEPPQPEKDGKVFSINDELAARGRQVFATSGCAACHQLKFGSELVKSEKAAKPLLELLNFGAGCLSSTAASGIPHYRLTASQRQQIEGAMVALKAGAERMPQQIIHETLAQFNCYACHERGKIGGVEETRNVFFETNMKEMGDEGRIPPALDGVGDKLNENYLRNLLANGAEDRGYMLAAMPKFGSSNVGHLQALFRQVDEKTEAKLAPYSESLGQMKAGGRQLAGDKGLGCIKCHPFDKNQATGIQAMDLTKMAGRLREDWFVRYMDNPQNYRPGTRMPAPWPFGNVTIKDVLDADGGKQVRAVWFYLTDGASAGIPAGVQREAIVLTPDKEPIIYRNFIEDVGPRGIAVGYPEKVNLCFDADQMCLALIWQNDFIDASKHWIGRGPGFQKPHGDNVQNLVRGAPFARLESDDTAWPTASAADQGYQFRGYRLNAKRQPAFVYSAADIQVLDEPVPVQLDKQRGFLRVLTVKSPSSGGKLAYRAAVGNKIEQHEDWYVVDQHLRVRVNSASGAARIRQSNGKQELIVDVELKNGEARIEQNYVW